MLNFFKTLLAPNISEDTATLLDLSEYELEQVKEKNFNFIAYKDTATKESPALKDLVRKTLHKEKGEIYVYDVTYQEKRQFDSVSYDYKYTHYQVYLTKNNEWEERYQKTTYSQNFED